MRALTGRAVLAVLALVGVVALDPHTNVAVAAPIVTVEPSAISADTTLVVTLDPNGTPLAAAVLVFALNPSAVDLVEVLGNNGFSASGVAGGMNFSFGLVSATNLVSPVVAGTVRLRGVSRGGQVLLDQQYYTDENLFDTAILEDQVVGTVVPPGTCPGLCAGSNHATFEDEIILVGLTLGEAVRACPSGDVNGDEEVSIADIVGVVEAAGAGCP